ncbi:TPA: hypothetical protein ACGG8A_003694 [Vibrio cholerae]
MKKALELQDLYNKTLDEFFEEVYSFWSEVPEKLVSDFIDYFPGTICLIVSRKGDLSRFKENLRTVLNVEIDELRSKVRDERKSKLEAMYDLPKKMPLTFNKKIIAKSDYPDELKGCVEMCIKKITQVVLENENHVYQTRLKQDFPKLNHHEVSKYMKLPEVCVEKLRSLLDIRDEIESFHKENKKLELSKKLELARAAWEQA